MKKAFTLAEVLITLVIIGVIAAITVPTIIAGAYKEEALAKTKKAYSTLSQAILRSKYDNGPIEEWYEAADKQAPKFFEKFFKPYLQLTKVCADYKECGYESSYPFKYLNGSSYTWNMVQDNASRFYSYLGDGVWIAVMTGSYPCIKYDKDGVTCLQSKLKFDNTPTVIMDINGPKKPNILGKDVFLLEFSNEKGTVPYCNSSSVASVNNNCKRGKSGTCCMKKIMMDSWQIKEGYPL